MDWSIADVAKLAGTTSRTLRHYDSIGLLAPSRVGANGYRYYDRAALVRLQRILLLRRLGMGLPQIGQVLEGQQDDVAALAAHLVYLQDEQARLQTQIRAVRSTLEALKGDEEIMAEKMFEGFDHTTYREEVEERWGAEAYAESDRWWRSLDDAGKHGFSAEHAALQDAWDEAQRRGLAPASAEAQELARRHAAWIAAGTRKEPDPQMLIGIAEMYVADDRFGANYTREFDLGAQFVRDALVTYARGLRG
ncbi:MerR family transcriptional regulator [Arthrobacter sp. zg-Y1171]|uniref:MerR family transcriptional regulator n=1 Tax=Arthrobacter sp. zg-Y1171 TaxID=2964610 RepID=UPI002105D484|nr:MerR family transcriptional regulator [Arthrobacter sp. zg-Y1171]MCQ1995678.1 MerR family transcriptional regulator [Arthrobacter sp. zg-Y1171]UWX83234.1 MerR family transcriptional regulator [Arthrobacter sp. zg-Y1171]